jgi:hypothetical protein
MEANEARECRPARVDTLDLHLCNQNVGRTVEIDEIAPPSAARTIDLGIVHQERIDALPAHAHIVDRALRRPELCPGALPGIAKLNRRVRSSSHKDGDKQHRHGTAHIASDPKHLR